MEHERNKKSTDTMGHLSAEVIADEAFAIRARRLIARLRPLLQSFRTV